MRDPDKYSSYAITLEVSPQEGDITLIRGFVYKHALSGGLCVYCTEERISKGQGYHKEM